MIPTRVLLQAMLLSHGMVLAMLLKGKKASHNSARDPIKALYAWRIGTEEEPSGPEQVDGFSATPRVLAVDRQVPSSQTRLPMKRRRRGWPAHLQARILLPKAKLAFCYMPKIASAQMSSLFDALNGANEPNWEEEPWESSGPRKLNISWSDVTKENGWKFAFFHRDPLARYLSAFGSKCVVNTEGSVEGLGKDCFGEILWTAMPLETMVTAFEERVRSDEKSGQPANNSHWFPMIKLLRACGINKFHPKVADFEGSLDADANSEVKRMFETMGVVHAYPDAHAMVDKYFPTQRVSGHSSQSHNKLVEFYRDPAVSHAVFKLYEEDYQRFRLPAILPHE